GGIDFVFRRTYRNQAVFFGPLGAKWDHDYNIRLREELRRVTVITGDLRKQTYLPHPRYGENGYTYYAPPAGATATGIARERVHLLRATGRRHGDPRPGQRAEQLQPPCR